MQDAAAAFTPEIIWLSADSPLTIEWNEADKIEPIQGSKATLTLASDTDRKFIDLYSVEAGAIRLDVYRASALYWSGTLDTELYEEPYSYKDNYDVQITFSDFAVWDRLKWDLRGFQTINGVINDLLAKSQLGLSTYDKTNVSTRTTAGADIFTNVQISADNFYDDDDVADSCRDALEAILQPLALRIVQRAGRIYIYDLNSIYSKIPVQVAWDGSDAVLAADKVYSDIIINFDPNFKSTLVEAKIRNLQITNSFDYFISYHPITGRRDSNPARNYDGFTFGYGREADSDYILYSGARFFKVEPKLSGTNETGIAYSFCHLPFVRDAQYIRYLNAVNMYSSYNYAGGGYLFELKSSLVILHIYA